jgi:hypothetical protein
MTEQKPTEAKKPNTKQWLPKIAAAVSDRSDRLKEWRENVSYRVMRPFSSPSRPRRS